MSRLSLRRSAALLVAASALACGRVPLQELSLFGATTSGGSTGGGSSSGGSSGGSTGGAVTVVSLAVTPPTVTAAVGTSVGFKATATLSNQTTLDVTQAATWSSSAPTVAATTGEGRLGVPPGTAAALTPGVATITASYQGATGTATLTVPKAVIAAIAVTPPSASTQVGATVSFNATASLSDGTTQDVTSSAVWSSSNPSVASVALGVASGLTSGTAAIQAAVGAVSGQAALTVGRSALVSIQVTPTDPSMAVGASQQLTATGTYSDGTVADLTQSASWASESAGVVTVAAGGLATAVAAGSSTVSATVGGVSGTTTVTVPRARLLSIAVAPASTTLIIGGTVQLTATGTYQDGTQADVTTAALWSSSAGAISVSNATGTRGLVTALAAGSATISAVLTGVSGAAQITVTAAKLVSISVTPPNASAPNGTSLQFTASGTYSDNSTVNLTANVTWATASAAVATISNAAGSAGLATATGLGSTTISATIGPISGTAALSVTAGVLKAIAITPANPTLAAGVRQSMTATGQYSDGTAADLTQTAVWTTADATVATVSNATGAQGQLVTLGTGSTTVTATAGSVSGSTTVTVRPPTASQLVVSPALATVPLGQTQPFTATLILSNATSQDVTRQASWSSSDTTVATISNGRGGGPGGGGNGGFGGGPGTATPVAAGQSTITATYQGLTGTATLDVVTAVPISISVTPIDPTLNVGTDAPFTATAIFSDGTSQNVTAQATWTSTDDTLASVSNGGGGRGGGGGPPGVVTPVAIGAVQISASWSGLTGSTTVTIVSLTLVSITVSPPAASVAVGGSTQFTAQGIYPDGSSQDLTRLATWTSSDSTIAGVSDANPSKGLATGLAAGSAQVQAAYQGVSGSATLTVTASIQQIVVSPPATTVAVGTPVVFTAQAILSDGSTQVITQQATWSSGTPTVAQVSDGAPTKGEATTLAAGSCTISAAYGGQTGTAVLTVSSASLLSIQLTPFVARTYVGYSVQLTATGLYSDNSTQDLTRLATWTVIAGTTIGAVSDGAGSKGLVTPFKVGLITVQASYQGVNGTEVVGVSGATLTSIAVTPATASIAVDATQQYDALGTFSDTTTLDVTSYATWLSSSAATAPVSNAAGSQGQATGLAAGTATITAVQGAVQGTASLTVQ